MWWRSDRKIKRMEVKVVDGVLITALLGREELDEKKQNTVLLVRERRGRDWIRRSRIHLGKNEGKI